MMPGMHASEVSQQPSKKRGPLFWVLIGVASFLVLVMIVFGAVAYFGLRTMQQTTGLDVDTMKKHPDYAISKLRVMADHDNVIVSEDIDTGEIHYRNSKTGLEYINKIDPATHRIITIQLQVPETK